MSNDKKLIFILDDDEMLLMMLEDHLSAHTSFIVNTFSSGSECLEKLYLNPAAIVLDFNLDSVESNADNGLAILRKIKNHNTNTPVVMLSSQSQNEHERETLASTATEYVIKDDDAFTKITETLMRLT